MKGTLKYIDHKTAKDFLLPRHYSGRTPSISQAFGWYFGNDLKAVCTFGKPASPYICKGICGEKWSKNVYELNRLCRTEDLSEPLSQFVSACLRRLRPNNWIVVSYSDTQMTHHGYIYQACNFKYTGCTKPRTDIYTGEGNHSRHYSDEQKSSGVRKLRSAKHRYVYFATSNKRLKKQWNDDLKYEEMPYPKGDQTNYELGTYIKDVLITEQL